MDRELWKDKILGQQIILNREELMTKMLDSVPDNIDKRQGSVVQIPISAVAPVLDELLMEVAKASLQNNSVTSTGISLDAIGVGVGVVRKVATFAKGVVHITAEPESQSQEVVLPVGFTFITKHTGTPVVFRVTQYIGDNKYNVESEQSGDIGNIYIGEVLPLDYVDNLKDARLIDITFAGIDEETDEEFRKRVISATVNKSFGGNVAYYVEATNNFSFVGSCQVHSAWDGGGTVLISAIGNGGRPLSSEAILELQEEIDPTGYQGKGIGLAPIGAVVTITQPPRVQVNVDCELVVTDPSQINSIHAMIEEGIKDYISEIQGKWSQSDKYNNYSISLFYSRIMAIIMQVQGVENVRSLLLNGGTEDMDLAQTPSNNPFPIFGEVKVVAG